MNGDLLERVYLRLAALWLATEDGVVGDENNVVSIGAEELADAMLPVGSLTRAKLREMARAAIEECKREGVVPQAAPAVPKPAVVQGLFGGSRTGGL